jgi:tetratricopeptide (TPR) repeat protein
MNPGVYLWQAKQQHGPYRLDDIKNFLRNGQISVTLMARLDSAVDWVPVYCIAEIRDDPEMLSMIRGSTSGDMSIEFEIAERTAQEVGQLIENLARAVSAENESLQKLIQQKMPVLWRQVFTFKAQFLGAVEARTLEARYYTLQALTKFNAAGFLRRQCQESSSLLWGVVTGLLAAREERTNAIEALTLLDKAIAVFDNPDDRLKKAVIYNLLGQRVEALRELERIVVCWRAEENREKYIEARQFRDEIEAA